MQKFPHRMTYIHEQCNCRVILWAEKAASRPGAGQSLCCCHSDCQWSWAIAWRGLWQQQHGCGGGGRCRCRRRSLLLRCCCIMIAVINEMYKRPAFLAKQPAFFGQTASVFGALMLPKEFRNNGTPFFFEIKKNAEISSHDDGHTTM